MIVSRTPLRISFVGGGSDCSSFYKYRKGAVISTTINKYIYIAVNKKFDDSIRAAYSITEIVDKVESLKHELIRESLSFLNIKKGIEIVSISDIPSRGTGLGSSSSYTVGLLNALYAYQSKYVSKQKLAKDACYVEIYCCKKPIGKQDQYAATYGNLNYIEFDSRSGVSVRPIICNAETREKLQENILLLYTGLTRSSDSILKEQNQELKNDINKRKILYEMAKLAGKLKDSLISNNINGFGEYLHENWRLKKQLAGGISNSRIDKWYKIARAYGATGGKILGAGGGGFLMLYAPKEKHDDICKALPELKPNSFKFETRGSKIVYYEDND